MTFVEANSAKVNGVFVTAGQQIASGTEITAVKTGDILFMPTENRTFITKVEFYYAGNGANNNYSVSFTNPPTTMEVGNATTGTYDSNNANVNPSWATPTFTSSNEAAATVNEYGVVTAVGRGTATITANLDIGPEDNGWSHHESASFTVSVTNPNAQPKYAYDPAVEVYDLTGKTGSISLGSSAGYSFATYAANYISNPNNYELNNRIAIQDDLYGSWEYNGGLKNKGSGYRLIGISNLRGGDRVKITFTGNDTHFSSKHVETYTFEAAGKVFYDIDDDGEQDCNEDVTITEPWTKVKSDAWYTMLEAGHLDIAIERYQTVTKIEIYSDRKASYIDTDNGDGSHTLTFDGTGQLVEKTAYIPGLRVEFGDASKEDEHFFVTQSDAGPVSWGYDHKKFKMARRSDDQTSLTKVPNTGTFYKFTPEISGTLNIDFKAMSVKYGLALTTNDPSNEEITGASCPYVFIGVDAYGNISDMTPSNHNFGNGNLKRNYNNGFKLVKGNTYYFYGWWPGYENNNVQITESCGVAKLLSAKYTPAFQMPELACVTEHGATSFDGSNSTPKIQITGNPGNLSFRVKKASENINTNGISITRDNNGYLQITGIGYKTDEKDHAGVILVSATADEGEHVFALTIPYSAAFNGGKGHRWDFFSEPLEIGSYFSNFYGNSKVLNRQKLSEADIAGMTKNDTTQLYREIEKASSDWTFTYRQVGMNGSAKDPMFQNVYTMEGDNADMIWETEGLWFDTPSNKSAIMNERLGAASQYSEKTDPDRYVAILPGGSFTIPALTAGDRVLIYMGSGYGSSADVCFFNITGALDAIGKPILPTDTYKAGGSLWTAGGGTVTYRGAYQFISTGGDMKFSMVGGSMTKIYSIEIYRGVKQSTVDATRVTSVTYNNEVYNTNRWWLNNDSRSDAKLAAYQLHYRGKGQRLKDPTPLYTSGNISTDKSHLFYATIGDNNAPHFFFKSEKGQCGTVRIRIDDMEMNDKYVADYALQNLTVGYLDVQSYPRTWDFTDLTGYVDTDNRIKKERTNVTNYAPKTVDENHTYDIEFMNGTVETGVKTIEQWKYYAADGDVPAGYGLHVRNEPFNGGVMWCSGQLYAGEEVFDETKGISFNVPVTEAGEQVHQQFNGDLRICEGGLLVSGGSSGSGYWSMTVPNVGTDAAVYVRASQVGSNHIIAGVGDADTEFDYKGTANDGTGDKIYAVKGKGGDMELFFNNVIIKKIAVATDAKMVNKFGWNTESREHAIDPSLMSYMTGKDFRAYVVTNANVEENTVTLVRIDGGSEDASDINADNTGKDWKLIVPAAENGSKNAYIVRYVDKNAKEDAQTVDIFNDDKGFHLFVPDMHDAANNDFSGNLLKARVTATTDNDKVPCDETIDGKTYNNYAFTSRHRNVVMNGEWKDDVQAFYRIVSAGASSNGNQAYLSIQASSTSPSRSAEPSNTSAAPQTYDIVFKDWSDLMTEKGDVNGDGMVTRPDIDVLTGYVTARKSNGLFKRMGDMNDDGRVDIVDMTLLIQKIMSE